MRTYDVLLIVDPRLTDEEVAQLGTRLQESLVALGGEVVQFRGLGPSAPGLRAPQAAGGALSPAPGAGDPASVREYERQLKLNESVLRFLTTRVVEGRRKLAPGGAAAAAPPGPVTPATSEVG